jgi:hypothetical protein
MIKNRKISLVIIAVALALAAAALVVRSARQLRADPQDQPSQNQQAQQPRPSQQDAGQATQDQKPSEKNKTLSSGTKAVTGKSPEQIQAAGTANATGIGEGEKISNMHPTAADRQQVTDMENYSVPPKDLKKFEDDGRLQPKK